MKLSLKEIDTICEMKEEIMFLGNHGFKWLRIFKTELTILNNFLMKT